jgi:hypothetical protein
VTFAQRACVAALAGGLALSPGGLAHADDAVAADSANGLALSFDVGPAVFQTVRTSYPFGLGTTDVDTTLAAVVSVAGTLSMGPVVAGIGADGTFNVISIPHAFAGGFVGGELKLGKLMVQFAAEGGGHVVTHPGTDWSHTSTAPNVILPYVGGRLRIDRLVRTTSRKGSILVGISAFYHQDVKHETVTGSLTDRCFGICEGSGALPGPDQFDVGGTAGGLVLDFTWWARGWFHPPPDPPPEG